MQQNEDDFIELPDVGEYVMFTIDMGKVREGYIERYNLGGFSGYPTSFALTDNPDISYPIQYLVENKIEV